MFEITEEAERAIRKARADSEMPRSTALRIAPVPTTHGGLAIGIAFTDGPEDGDMKVSVKDDLVVYVAPELATTWERATLKVTADDEGIELELRTQADLHDHGAHGDNSLGKMLIGRREGSGEQGRF
jgi:Fe-S cluster assembly iron-binding protein IscA